MKWLLAKGSPVRGGLSKLRARGPCREPARSSATSAEAAPRGRCRGAALAAAPCLSTCEREVTRNPSHPEKSAQARELKLKSAAGKRAACLKPSAQVAARSPARALSGSARASLVVAAQVLSLPLGAKRCPSARRAPTRKLLLPALAA